MTYFFTIQLNQPLDLKIVNMRILFRLTVILIGTLGSAQGIHLWSEPVDVPQIFVNPDETKLGVYTKGHLSYYDLNTGKEIYSGNFIYDGIPKFRGSEHVTSYASDFSRIILMNDERSSFWGLNTSENKWELPKDRNKNHWFLDIDAGGKSVQIDKKQKELYKILNGKRVVIAEPFTQENNHFIAGSGRYSVFKKDDDSRILLFDHFTNKSLKFPENGFVIDKELMKKYSDQPFVFARSKDELAIYDIEADKVNSRPLNSDQKIFNSLYSSCINNHDNMIFKGQKYYYSLEVDEALISERPADITAVPYKIVQYYRSNCMPVQEINFSKSTENFLKKQSEIDSALAIAEAKKEAEKQKELERIAAKKAPIFKMPGQNIFHGYWRVDPTGRYIAFSRKDAEQVAVWDLETLEQVYNYIKPKSKKNIGYWDFSYDDSTGNMLMMGFKMNSGQGVYSMIDKNEYIEGAALPRDKGTISLIIGREAGMIVGRFEKDKKGRLKLNKPLWSQIQFYNVDTKKWRTKRFEGARDLELSLANNILMVKYPKRIELFKYKDLSLANLRKIGEVKTKNLTVRYNYEEPNKIYFVKRKKSGFVEDAISYDIATGKTEKVDEKWANDLAIRNRVNRFVPQLENIDLNGHTAVKLTVTDRKTGEMKSTFITAENKDEVATILAQIKDFHDNDVEAQVELAEQKLRAQQRQKDVDYFLKHFEFIGTGKSYSLVNMRGRDINSLPIANEILGQTWGQKSAIGKVMDCGGTYMLFYVINGSNNTDVRLAQVTKAGGFIRKINLVSVPVVNGRLAAETQFTFFKSGNGVRFDYTKLDLRTGKKTSKQIKCPCNSSWQ